ncbi:MAG TPA: hypothetical protein VN841_15265 [Bryobacteraceae bacterium]|nr:hypothetical protein [Bryobacteraceae bacterium]
MKLQILAVVCGMSCLVLADDEFKQKVQVTKTEHVDFPSGGTVRLENSTGELTVEGWDQPGVEMITVKSTKAEIASAGRENAFRALDRVRIAMERKGAELVITTDFPRHRGFPPPSPLGSATNFDLQYRIRVPRDTRLIVGHDVGEVHLDGLTSDIHATVLQGGITLRVPPEGQYVIDAKSDLGNVISDFPGSAKRRFWLVGHEFMQSSAASHKLYLRDGFGDIIILKIRTPQTPPPLNR